ncbi:MAG: hypothetical protein ACPGLV_12900 [Bacteroidia bacterium]
MRTLIIAILLIVLGQVAKGQNVVRYNFGKPATVVSFVKEVIVWEEGKKVSHDSYAGDKSEIFLSDSLVRVTEKDTVIEFLIKEVRVDDFENVSFLDKQNNVLRWIRQTRLFQIEPAKTTEEIIYYCE